MKYLNRTVGQAGENVAVECIINAGYVVLERNYTTPFGEIDIVAKDGDYLVFIEVKSRATNAYGRASQAVDYHKQKKISQVAANYIKDKKLFGSSVRFDVVEVDTSLWVASIIQDAFYAVGVRL